MIYEKTLGDSGLGPTEQFYLKQFYASQEQHNLEQFRLLAAPCILLIDLSHDTIGINAKVA